jgi:hypothetical protein
LTPPPHKALDSNLFWNKNNNKPAWKVIGKHLYNEGKIFKEDFKRLIRKAAKIFRKIYYNNTEKENNIL